MILRNGEGEPIGDGKLRIKADRDSLFLGESRYEAGRAGASPHIHHHHADAFYVIEGRLSFLAGPDQKEHILEAGAFAAAPPNLVHGFDCPEDVRYLNVHAPQMGFADYLRSGADWDSHDPPADGGLPLSAGILRPAGEGERIGPALIKMGKADALGSFSVIEVEVESGFLGPPPHSHRTMTDSFYVLEGELTVRDGDERHTLGPGDYAYFPPNTVHTFANESNRRVRVLAISVPAGIDDYMRASAGGGLHEQGMAAHDVYLAN